MNNKSQIVKTSCPQCGQDALIVIRHPRVAFSYPPNAILGERCHECQFADLSPVDLKYQRAACRLAWLGCGGGIDAMPQALRTANDPSRGVHAVLNPSAEMPADGNRQLDGTTPHWKNPAKRTGVSAQNAGMPRLLAISHDLSRTGAPRFLLSLLSGLRGFAIDLATLADGPLAEEARSKHIPVVSNFVLENYDLVLLNTVACHVMAKRVADAGKPFFWVIHEEKPEPFLASRDFVTLQRLAAGLIFCSAIHRDEWRSLTTSPAYHISPAIMPILPRPKRYARHVLRLPPDKPVIVSFGTSEARKGHSMLKAAATGLNLKVCTVSNHPDPDLWLSAADALVCSSLWEGWSLSLQEAKSIGLPIIATATPGNTALLGGSPQTTLVKPGSVDAMKEALRTVVLRGDNCASSAVRSEMYRQHQASLGRYERLLSSSVGTAGLRETPLRVVYHVASMGGFWKKVVREQLSQLADNGIENVIVTHCGPDLDQLRQLCADLPISVAVVSHHDSLLVYERPAIERIQMMADTGDDPILYLHTKGVSYPSENSFFSEWRRLMMDALVPSWRQHVSCLKDYDAIGVNWWTAKNKGHFSGNFWFARCDWLRRLPRISDYWRDRYSAERWIGSVEPCRFLSLCCTDAAFWDADRGLFNALRKEQIESKKGEKNERQ